MANDEKKGIQIRDDDVEEDDSTIARLKNLLSLVRGQYNDTERKILELAAPIVEGYLEREASNG